MRIYFRSPNLVSGFSLVEMAVVLVILGFVLAALMLPLQAQQEQLQRTETENALEIAKKALIGYAQSQGRLPCPATNNGTGIFPDDNPVSNPIGGGACAQQVGFLPAATLGIQPTDAQGFAIDGWNNRIRYAITQVNTVGGAATPDFTTANEMANVGLSILAPDLRVCTTSTGVTIAQCSAAPESNFLINNAVAVIFSTGATAAQGAGGADETENLNAVLNVDNVFVSHGITAASAPNGEFDHLVVWISPFVLYNAMIEAGQLH